MDASTTTRRLWRYRLPRYLHPANLALTQGSHICQAAIQKGCAVTSISRSANPSRSDDTITYSKGDIFQPEQYRHHLPGARAVIYSAGILLEADYKDLVRGQFDLRKAIGALNQLRARNPLSNDPAHPRPYDKLNRDGGLFPIKGIN